LRKKARGIELELVFAYETASPQLSASLRNFYLVFIAFILILSFFELI